MVNISGVSIPDALTYAETGNAGPHAITRFLDDKDTPDPSDDLDLQYSYDASQQRIVQVSKVAGSGSVRKKLSVGPFELESTATPASPHQHESWRTWTWNRQSARVLVSAPGAGLLGVVSFPMSSMQALTAPTRHAFVSDHLGSIVGVVTAAGSLVERSSYDAWGHARNPDTGVLLAAMPQRMADRGFTGHEELPNLDLVHMNGRIYDPLATRFLSPDPFVQFPEFDQSYNRYSYVLNNPLTFTDPSGYFIPMLVGLALSLTPVSFTWTVVTMALVAFAQTLILGGTLKDALMAAAISVATAVVARAIGNYFDKFYGGAEKIAKHKFFGHFKLKPTVELARATSHGVSGGAFQAAGGGRFKDGFLGGFAGELGMTLAFETTGMQSVLGSPRDGSASGLVARTLTAGIIGGTASELGGGKFSNGALSAAVAWLFNTDSKPRSNSETKPTSDTNSLGPLADPNLRAGMRKSWFDSKPYDAKARHEEGGYYGKEKNGKLGYRRWPSGGGASIVPPARTNGMYQDLIVQGEWHTHPNPPVDENGIEWIQGGHEGDWNGIRAENYPGDSFIISREGVFRVSPAGQETFVAPLSEALRAWPLSNP